MRTFNFKLENVLFNKLPKKKKKKKKKINKEKKYVIKFTCSRKG